MSEYIVRETGYPGTLKQEIVGELVRCKDCKWRTGLEMDDSWHPCDEVAVNDNWYCADGERKDNETD